MELSTRKVKIAGVAAAANGLWMSQIGRLTDTVEGILHDQRYPQSAVHRRVSKPACGCSGEVGKATAAITESQTRTPERFVGTIKESCLKRMILFGEKSLRKEIHEFVSDDHGEGNHQGLGNRGIVPDKSMLGASGTNPATAVGRQAQLLAPCRGVNIILAGVQQ
jgi:putative transposase